MNLLRFLFGFQGRFNRAKFLVAFYAVGLLCAPFEILAFANGAVALIWVSYVPALVGISAAGAKRLHDRDKSAWWLALYYGVPLIIGTLDHVARGTSFPDLNSSIAGIFAVPFLAWGTIELTLLPGTPGANRFGPGWLTTEPRSFPPA